METHNPPSVLLSTSLKREGSLAQANSPRLGEISSKGHFNFLLKLAYLAQAKQRTRRATIILA